MRRCTSGSLVFPGAVFKDNVDRVLEYIVKPAPYSIEKLQLQGIYAMTIRYAIAQPAFDLNNDVQRFFASMQEPCERVAGFSLNKTVIFYPTLLEAKKPFEQAALKSNQIDFLANGILKLEANDKDVTKFLSILNIEDIREVAKKTVLLWNEKIIHEQDLTPKALEAINRYFHNQFAIKSETHQKGR